MVLIVSKNQIHSLWGICKNFGDTQLASVRVIECMFFVFGVPVVKLTGTQRHNKCALVTPAYKLRTSVCCEQR